MYRIDILLNYKWKYLCESDNIYVINKTIEKTLKSGHQIRVLKSGRVLAFLNDILEYDYWLMLVGMEERYR